MSKKPTPPPFTVSTSKPTVLEMVPAAQEPTCGACLFFRVTPSGQGLCYRYPTTVRKDSISFCGEYKPK